MKKMIVAIDEDSELTKEQKDYVEQLSRMEEATVVGVIDYPTGLILNASEVFVEAMKDAGIDVIVAMSPEFIFNEFVNDGNLSKMCKQENIKIIEATMDMELHRVRETMPGPIKTAFEQSIQEKFPKRENVLVITTTSESNDGVTFAEEVISENRINMMAIATLPEYIPEMEDTIRDIIKDKDISKVVVYERPESQDFNHLLEKIESNGVEVIENNGQEMKQDMNINIFGMHIH